MDTNIFESAFFGWKNLPTMIEYQGRKLIPLKTLKLKNGGKPTHHNGLFSVSEMRRICERVGITLYRPTLGLYCISEDECSFFSYLHKSLGCKWWIEENLISYYHNFRAQIVV